MCLLNVFNKSPKMTCFKRMNFWGWNIPQTICFSDLATCHVSGKSNKHNVRIWESEHPHVIRELQQNSHINKPGYKCAFFWELIILWGFAKHIQ